jgi:hypothetical protein
MAKGSHHIRTHEIVRPMDRTIHVALGCEVDDRPRMMFLQKLQNQFTVADVALNKAVERILRNRAQVGRVSGVGELVEIDDGGSFGRPATAG